MQARYAVRKKTIEHFQQNAFGDDHEQTGGEMDLEAERLAPDREDKRHTTEGLVHARENESANSCGAHPT